MGREGRLRLRAGMGLQGDSVKVDGWVRGEDRLRVLFVHVMLCVHMSCA